MRSYVYVYIFSTSYILLQNAHKVRISLLFPMYSVSFTHLHRLSWPPFHQRLVLFVTQWNPITINSASRSSYYTDYTPVSSVISFRKNKKRETIQYYIWKQVCLNTYTTNYTPLIDGPLINSLSIAREPPFSLRDCHLSNVIRFNSADRSASIDRTQGGTAYVKRICFISPAEYGLFSCHSRKL